MDDKLDAGPILAQEAVPITAETTVEELVKAIREIGTAMIMDILDDFQQGIPVYPKPQDEGEAMRCYPRLPEYGRIDWTESAARIDRHIRSLGGPYPEAYTYHGRNRVNIHEASVLEPCPDHLAEPGHIVRSEIDGDIWVGTGKGILIVSEISTDDNKQISPGEEFRSIRDRFGMNLQKQVRKLSKRVAEMENRLNEK
jgi:UDP-4-amino-4-deoxy-L-arabinose formyltransferase/UDP-glucuronic acid dehydrogenase (UDP-4-keto-hexauronic acid decarboxylating)